MTPIIPTKSALGAALIAFSAAIFGLTGTLTKPIHAAALTGTCGRGRVGAGAIGAYVLIRRRRSGESLTLGWRGWALALVGALASIAFITSFKLTLVANVTIVYSTIPFIAALLGWLLIGERLRQRTFVAALVSILGVGVMVAAGLHGGGNLGNLAAIVMTLLSALYIVMIRMFQDTPAVWAGAVSAFLLLVLGWFVSDPLAVDGHDAALLLLFGLSFAIASIAWTEGARLIPASESALLGLIEVPCGIGFAILFLGEMPPMATALGGLIVVASTVWHSMADWREARLIGPSVATT